MVGSTRFLVAGALPRDLVLRVESTNRSCNSAMSTVRFMARFAVSAPAAECRGPLQTRIATRATVIVARCERFTLSGPGYRETTVKKSRD